ncbi:NAD(P)H-binding protein [Limosilactobacillus portuensis]|uniref:NAD(P)H-binding protein n=1 Tax=Limosilactobacillus portuensis TaxID=2742601 RepID=UPI0023596404|nr:NAD(P)H-binding protein [Limosilactobacillus portuensis]WCT61508.1 NAD(P)H-binding protein [Limosilactobacillus portuensis]
MSKIIINGVDGNLGKQVVTDIINLIPKKNVILTAPSDEPLQQYQKLGFKTAVIDFTHTETLDPVFKDADKVLLISMPFVGKKRRQAHKNVIDAAKKAGVKQIIYTSLVNADDPTNPSVEKKDHIYTENYIKDSGLDYIFLRNSQYAEAMITNYFTYVKSDGVLKNNQGDGLMAYISRRDCAKAAAYALASNDYHHAILNINGPEAMTISKFIQIGNEATGNHVTYQEITDEQNYEVFDAMGVPRTTDGKFKEDSEAPFSSDGMVTFGQAIREGKMSLQTNDFQKLTGDEPLTVRYMFEHANDFQIGARHSEDK